MKGRRGVRFDVSVPPAATLPGWAEQKSSGIPAAAIVRSRYPGTCRSLACNGCKFQPSSSAQPWWVPAAPAKFALDHTPRQTGLQFDKNSRAGSEARSSGPAVHARLEDWRSRYEHAAPKQYFSGRSSRWSLTECMARLKMRRRARSVKTRDPSGRRWLRHPDSSGAVGPHRRADNHGRHARAESGRQRDAGSSRCAGPRVESFAAITELCRSV